MSGVSFLQHSNLSFTKSIISGTSNDALETMKLVYSIYYNDEKWRNKFNIKNPIN